MGKYDLFLNGTVNRSLLNPGQATESTPTSQSRSGPSFEQILAAELPAGNLRLTDEVKAKLKQVGIELKPLELDRMGRAIDKLKESGSQKGMLVSDKVAVVVDVAERTLTDAMSRIEARDQVVSSIDSVMLIDE